MKKLIFSLSLFFLAFGMYAQSAQYTESMKKSISKLETMRNDPEAYHELSNSFMRIAEAEKTEWLPKYYAAYALIMEAMLQEKEVVDQVLDNADKILSDIAKTTANDEILVLQSFSKSTRIAVDPITRGMKYGPESTKLLLQAKAMNPENPRIYFLQGQSAFYTPEQFGGGKSKALPLYQTALEKYAHFKMTNELMPTWGREITMKMMSKAN